MKTDKKGVKSSHGGSKSKGGRSDVGMKSKGDKLSKTSWGGTTQPSKTKDCSK